MNFTPDEQAIATQELVAYLEKQVEAVAPEISPWFKVPQRKARYNDKNRIRFKEAKEWALTHSGCSSTKEIKHYLKILGKRYDLRYTSSWVSLRVECADAIKQLKDEVKFEVGDRVEIKTYHSTIVHLESWSPFFITEIANGKAMLDCANFFVPLSNLVAV